MANTLTLTINVVTKNAKEINELIDRVDKLNDKTGDGAPKAEKLGSGINAASLAAGAAAVGIGLLAGQVGGYVKSAIDAAARTEGLRNGLRVVIPDAEEFEETLARIDKQARLPGLQKNDLVKFTTSMRAAGLTGDQTESALTILGSRITGFGQTSAEAAQVVGQFTQAMNRGKIEGDELNRLFESLPGFKNIVVEMTGVTGGAQDLNNAFAAQGKTVQEGIIPLLEAYDASLGAIKHDAALTKVDAYEGALEDLRNTIGQKLLPVYKTFLDRGGELADNISSLITGATELPQPILDIKEAFDGYLESLEPLIEPLENLGNSILPLLKTLWNELVGVFIDFVIPSYGKLIAVLTPVITKLVELATPIANLINIYLPPLLTILKGLATIIIDIVLVPLRALAGAFGWVIEKITDLINLIPGAKSKLETTATASDKAATAADKQATATDSATTAIKTQKGELDEASAKTKNFAEQSKDTATKQTELKVAVAASNIELKNAKQALKDATNPEEIEAASERVETAIENVKNAKVSEAKTFEDESKKQIAILKAENEAQNAHETVVKIASKNREQYAEDLTEKEQDEAKNREIAIENEVGALSQLITSYTTNTQTEFDTRAEAFCSYKDKRISLSDEIIRNIEESEMTEAQKAEAIRKTHEDLSGDLSTEWKKITAAEKAELETQKRQAEEESKLKADAIKAQNEAILNQTEAYLINSESAYKTSFGRSEKEQGDAFDRLLVSLTTHHAAEITAAKSQGKDTQVLEQKQAVEIEKLNAAHLTRLQKQNDDAAIKEQKERDEALNELKALEEGFFEAVEGATRDFHDNQEQEQEGFYLDWNAGAKEGLQVFKDAWEDILFDIIELGKQYIEDMKDIADIQIKAEQDKQALFAKMSEDYFTLQEEAVEKLRILEQDRIKIYQDAQTAIQKALDDHGIRLADIEKTYNDNIFKINTDAIADLKRIGIDSNRDRLDDTLDFYIELESIEKDAHIKRERAASTHTSNLASISNQRSKKLSSASTDFVSESIKAYNKFLAVIENPGNITDIVGAQNQLNTDIGKQLQVVIRSAIGDEADALFSIEGFNAFNFLGITGNDLTSENFVNTLVSKLPGAIGSLRKGDALTDVDRTAQSQSNILSQQLQGVSVNANTGGILGTFVRDQNTEGERYLNALDNIDQWEIAANEVVVNAKSLILQAGVDRTDEGAASLTQRDDETQTIAETHNQGQAGITNQEIGIKQETRDTLNQLIVDYANQALTIDAETRVAIQEAQKQAADSFWSGVLEIGGTVLGVAAGVAVSAATGGAVPPNIAIGLGAQLGKAGGGLLADAVVGGDDAKLFHYPSADEMARRAGRSAGSGNSDTFSAIKRENADDFSKYFGEGFAESTGGGLPLRASEVHILAEKVILKGMDDIDRAESDMESDKGDSIASGGGGSGGGGSGGISRERRPTMDDVLGKGVGFSNYKSSIAEWKKDPLGMFIKQGDVDEDVTAEEAFANSTTANYWGSLLNAVQAYKNTGDESLFSLIKYYAKLAGGLTKRGPVSAANLLFTNDLGHLLNENRNALFHFPETDFIARDMARSETLRKSEETPYFADQNQIRNARDVSREIVAGVMEGLKIGDRDGLQSDSQQPLKIEITQNPPSDNHLLAQDERTTRLLDASNI